jgi:hypothetical protein
MTFFFTLFFSLTNKSKVKKMKQIDSFPLFDHEILKLRHQKEKLHAIMIKIQNAEIVSKFKHVKQTFNTMLRNKK